MNSNSLRNGPRAAARWVAIAGTLIMAKLGAVEPANLNIEGIAGGRVRVAWAPGDGSYVLEKLRAWSPDGSGWETVGDQPEFHAPWLRVDLAAGESSSFFRLRIDPVPGPVKVPDPTPAAAPLPPGVTATFLEEAAFLHTGEHAVQLGMAPGAVEAVRAAGLRGVVRTRDGAPLGGVRVALRGHPELGLTYTRSDGTWDLVANGGIAYRVDFETRGYCPAQRIGTAAPGDFGRVDEVRLVAMDPVGTPVAFGAEAGFQVAPSTTQTDAAGSRSATVVFAPGTRARLEMPDGTTRDAGSLVIRSTEFTVGPDGLAAMPGPLPPASAYTYAAEFSGDEAVAAGARTIRFDRPVHVYVDNFLGMPTGSLIPSGYYDRDRAAWVPQDNGVVVAVLGTEGGKATLDVDGDGQAENAAALAAAAFDDTELSYLASRYAAGKTFWRMPLTHFTALDFNNPVRTSDPTKPNTPGDKANPGPGEGVDGGGRLNLARQVFEETVPLAGTPMALHYSSARVPGYRANAELDVPLTSDTLPDALRRVELSYDIAGRHFESSFEPATRLSSTVGWDGFDAFGRAGSESRVASVQLAYHYPRIYGGNAILASIGGVVGAGFGPPLFGNFGQFDSTIGHGAVGEAAVVNFQRILTVPDQRRAGLGGWSLTPHHRYDPRGRILYRGDGTVREAADAGDALRVSNLTNLAATLLSPVSDGSFHLVTRSAELHRVMPDGTAVRRSARSGEANSVVANSGSLMAADGLNVGRIFFNQVPWWGVATGPDDSVYLRGPAEIVRVFPDGTFRVVVGAQRKWTYAEDGSPARDSYLSGDGNSLGLAVGPDSTVYFPETASVNGRTFDLLRKVTPDGRILTIAGKGGRHPNPFGGETLGFGKPAIDCVTIPMISVALGHDGSVYFADGQGVNRVTPGGILETRLNGGLMTWVGFEFRGNTEVSEGKPAVSKAPLRGGSVPVPAPVRLGPDGTIYTVTHGSGDDSFLWKIGADGLVQRIAGLWFGPYDEGYPPTRSSLGNVFDFAVDHRGLITLLSRKPGNSTAMSLRQLGTALPGFDPLELKVPSEDGRELYIFSGSGLHRRTVDTISGADLWTFGYDPSNRLTALTDREGRTTRIERDGSGAPTAVVGPQGHRTSLGLDANGYLATIAGPVGTTKLGHSTGGLLETITGPNGRNYEVSYDARGRATSLVVPESAKTTVEHTEGVGGAFTVRTRSSTGDVSVLAASLSPNGDSEVDLTLPDGTVVHETRDRSRGFVATHPNGMTYRERGSTDPRLPSGTDLPQSISLRFPDGTVASQTFARSWTPDASANRAGFGEFTETVTVNGRSYRGVYNATNRHEELTFPSGRILSRDFDEKGRLTASRLGGDEPTAIERDVQGQIRRIRRGPADNLAVFELAYDATGVLQTVQDPQGGIAGITWDSAGRPAGITTPGGGGLTMTFDGENQLTSLSIAGAGTHTFEHDARGLLTRYLPPSSGAADPVGFGRDADGRLTSIQWPEAQPWVIERGPGGRAQRMVLGSGPTLDFSYSPATGLASGVTSSDGNSMTFGYWGSIPTLTRWRGAVTGEVAVAFTADLLPRTIAVNGVSDSYGYDADLGLVKAGPLTLERDPASGRLAVVRAGAIEERFEYDGRGRATNHVVTANGQVLKAWTTQFDVIDRETGVTESGPGLNAGTTYGYDPAGRLVAAMQSDGTSTLYHYDVAGQRTHRGAETVVHDAQGRVTSHGTTGFGWSRNGWLASRTNDAGRWTYLHDARGFLASVAGPTGTVSYVLDATGHRIGRQAGGALERGWLWLGNRVVAEVNGNSALTKRFIHAGDAGAPLAMVAGNQVYRIVCDARGSVRMVVDVATGVVAQEMAYDEFGRVAADTNPGFQPFGFAGGLWDASTGLVHFGLRDYDPTTGEWIERDPVLFAGGQTSLYAYCANDTVNRVDPIGAGPFSPPKSLFLGPSTSANWFGAGGSLTFGVIADNEGNVGLSFTSGAGVAVGAGADLTGTITATRGNIYATRGLGWSAGGSGGAGIVAGLDVVGGSDVKPYGGTFQAGGGFGLEAHAYATDTFVTGVNVFGLGAAASGLLHGQNPMDTYYSYGQPKPRRSRR